MTKAPLSDYDTVMDYLCPVLSTAPLSDYVHYKSFDKPSAVMSVVDADQNTGLGH